MLNLINAATKLAKVCCDRLLSAHSANFIVLPFVIVNQTIFVVRLFCATSPPAPWGISPSAHPLVTPLARGRQLVLYVGPTHCQHV